MTAGSPPLKARGCPPNLASAKSAPRQLIEFQRIAEETLG